jgi:hypothetical protein
MWNLSVYDGPGRATGRATIYTPGGSLKDLLSDWGSCGRCAAAVNPSLEERPSHDSVPGCRRRDFGILRHLGRSRLLASPLLHDRLLSASVLPARLLYGVFRTGSVLHGCHSGSGADLLHSRGAGTHVLPGDHVLPQALLPPATVPWVLHGGHPGPLLPDCLRDHRLRFGSDRLPQPAPPARTAERNGPCGRTTEGTGSGPAGQPATIQQQSLDPDAGVPGGLS